MKARHYLWHALRRINLDQSWFEAFRPYWTDVLGGRPLLAVQDLYFIQGLYRVRYQDLGVPDTRDAHLHLEAWQRPEVLYQLLGLTYKESFRSNFRLLQLLRKFGQGRTSSLLEFGCATAPITTSLFEFYPPTRDARVYISDIKTLAFHYATYKFRECPNVLPILLEAKEEFRLSLPQSVDTIFCITVFEHLNKPLETVKLFHQYLTKGGLLIFDYFKSAGEAWDTEHAVREREQVLEFVSAHFNILQGGISKAETGNLTVAQKK